MNNNRFHMYFTYIYMWQALCHALGNFNLIYFYQYNNLTQKITVSIILQRRN